ncbi:MAG: SBBP repeat-containing protein [Acidobacteria bacterium]|nr:SBBP repeat-containing protein [Acidobacteriota bacterium]
MSKNLRILVGLTAFVALILASALHGAQEYPVLKWHTYAGSSKDDHGASMAVDPSGNIYLAGWSDATWGSPINPHSGGRDAFVAKLNSTGGLEWNTFVGSSDYDEAEAITVDGSGNVYVVGWSGARWGSTGEPFLFGWGAFVAKLNTNGELQWHRFMTPDGGQVGLAAAVDANGDVYVGGWGGLVWETPPSEPASGSFVAKLDSSGAEVWHAFIRDTGPYGLQALAVDVSGNVYAAGRSELPWGSPINPYTGGIDGFVAKLNNTGKLAWNTFMGSSGSDLPEAIALDGSGNVYAAGWSEATWGTPLNPHGGGASDAFAAKLDSSGVRQWNTFMGGTGGWDIAVDGGQNVYVTGVGAAHPGFVAALNRDGALQWNTYLEAILYSIALDQSGNVHVAGSIPYSWGTPVNPWAGGWDAFVAKLDFATPAAPTLYIVSGDKQNGTVGVALPAPLVVLLRSTAGPVAGARVTFSSTGATLNPASVYTSVDGRASSVATPTASGTVTVNVALAGAAPVVFTANVQAAPAPVTFTSAASFRGGPLAAGMIAVAWGQGFTTGTNVASSIPLPTTLGNVTVTVRDSSGTERAQPLFFTSATQINFYLAAETQRGPATIRITGSDARVQTANVTIESVCPGLFSMNADGQGVAAGNVVRVSASGAQTFLDIMRYDNAQRKWVGQPIDFGTPTDRIFLVLYGTGLRNRTSLANVSATIGGIQVQADYLGAQGTLVGLDQFNVELPRATAGMGEVPISLTVDGKTANTVTVTTVAAVVPPPALTSVTPTSARIGETIQSFVITGTNLSGVTAVQFSPSAGITVSNISASASQVTAQLVISADAPVGARSVAVVSPAGTSNALTFTVQQALPTPGVWTGKDIYFFVAADGTHLIVGGPLSRSLQMAIPTCTGSLYIGMDDVIPIINGRFDHTKSGTQSGGWSIAVSGVFDSPTHASVRAQHTDSAGCSKTTTGYEATPSQ